MSATKRVTIAYAAPGYQLLCRVVAAESATVHELLALAKSQSDHSDVPWCTADVGIFGELCERDTVPRDGDRVELYRPLLIDPKESRRHRARRRGQDSD